MYRDFYKLRVLPFATTCDERFFFESAIHAEALANMMYTVQQRKGMVLVTGEVGAGKTFLSNMLSTRLGPSCQTIRLSNPPQSPKQLIRAVASALGIRVRASADKLTLVDDLEENLARIHSRGRLVALILDESQDLPAGSLQELRLLWNWERNGERLIQIVLVGQPELRDHLSQPRWEPLRQRIVLSYHLGHLSAEEASAYIDHRIRVAGGDDCLAEFTPAAKSDVYAASGGVPRLINVLCDNSLLVGYARGIHCIDRPIIAAVLRDMTCWNLTVSREEPAPSQARGAPLAP